MNIAFQIFNQFGVEFRPWSDTRKNCATASSSAFDDGRSPQSCASVSSASALCTNHLHMTSAMC